MKLRKFISIIILCVTFTIGFSFGVFYKTNSIETIRLEVQNAPGSEKAPFQKALPKRVPASQKVLIGYVQDYHNPSKIDYTNLTHVVFSFAHPTKEGKLILNGDMAKQNLKQMVSLAHKHDTKVMLAVGGWYHINGGETYDYFKEAIANHNSRKTLIQELVNISYNENLDGIDIDFEHPRSKEDAQLLNTFIKELNEKLIDKELSIAVYSKIHSVTGKENHSVVFNPSMFQYVDYVNIMAYDGQWDGAYNAANLSPYPFIENIVNYWSQLFDTHSISKEKLVLGVPFYAQPKDPHAKQLTYSAIVNRDVSAAYNDLIEIDGMEYHYNGIETIQRKTKLAIENGFGGMMLWEAGFDVSGPNSLTASISNMYEQGQQQELYYSIQ